MNNIVQFPSKKPTRKITEKLSDWKDNLIGKPEDVRWLRLDEYVQENSSNQILYVHVWGDSFEALGIKGGDLIVVNRSLSAKAGDLIAIDISGEGKPVIQRFEGLRLVESNNQGEIYGVVTHCIRNFRKSA